MKVRCLHFQFTESSRLPYPKATTVEGRRVLSVKELGNQSKKRKTRRQVDLVLCKGGVTLGDGISWSHFNESSDHGVQGFGERTSGRVSSDHT